MLFAPPSTISTNTLGNPPRFILPLKQLADTLASSARFDRIFALSNGVFHVKHRFFYCFSIEILPVFIAHFACFSLLRFVLLDYRVCLVKRFVCFYHICSFAEMLLPVLSAGSPLFCGVGCLMWVGLSMSFCGGNKPMDFCCFVLQQMLKPLLHDKISVLAELFVVVCVWLRCFCLCLCYLSLRART